MHCLNTAWVAGITMQRTPGATLRPRMTWAAARMSSMRPLVQLPMTAWSMEIWRLSSTGWVLLGRCGQETQGLISAASMWMTRAYSASASAWYSTYSRWQRPSSQARATSSTSMMPALPPASIAMLEMVMRPSMESASMVEPANSMAWYSAPSTPMRPMMCRMMSLALAPAGSSPSISKRMVGGTLNHARPVAQAHARVRGAHARGKGTQRAVGAGVGVRADDEVAGHHGTDLGQQRVLDAGAALFPVVGDLLLMGKIAHLLGLLGALDVLVGRVVVGHQANAIAIEYALGAQLAEHIDGDGRGDIVREDYVEVALDQLSGSHLVQAGMCRQDLLGYGHGSGHGNSFLRLATVRQRRRWRFLQRARAGVRSGGSRH